MILVAEVKDPAFLEVVPIEQQIVCPTCGAFISTLTSAARVVTYAVSGEASRDEGSST
jgi:hypothetical protein